jgi:Repeat of unknown function (DUF5907)
MNLKNSKLLLLISAVLIMISKNSTAQVAGGNNNVLGTTNITSIQSTTAAGYKLSIGGAAKHFGTGTFNTVASPALMFWNTNASATARKYVFLPNNTGQFLLYDSAVSTTNFIYNGATGKIGLGAFGAASSATPILPDSTLHIIGGFKLVNGTQGLNKILISDAAGGASWQVQSGDATSTSTAGSWVTTIGANKITYAKLQAASITGRLLGSSSTGTAIGELKLGTGLTISNDSLKLTSSGGTGTVTAVSTAAANNGVTATWTNPSTTPALTIGLGAITPASVAATGTVTASNLSGTNTGNVTLAGENYLSLTGQAITANAVNLSGTNVTGTLAFAKGGLGFNTLTTGDLLFGSATNTLGKLTAGTSGYVLASGGPGVAPIWTAPGGGSTGWSLTGNTSTIPGTNFIGTTDAQRLVFKTNNTEKVTILENGNVGIGNNNPSVKLEVNGEIVANGRATFNGTGFTTSSAYAFNSPKNTIAASFGSGSTLGMLPNEYATAVRFNGADIAWGDLGYYPGGGGNGSQGNFRFSLAGSAVNTTPSGKLGVGELYSEGSIGIGTTTPLSNLHINKDINGGTGILITNTNAGNSTASHVTVGGVLALDQTMSMYYGGTNNAVLGALTANLTANGGTTGGMNINVVPNAPLRFLTNNTQRMIVGANGNVGIGTTAVPVDYKLAVAGNIIAEKIKVKLQSAGWPDYVFDKKYPLLPLPELEKFITKNKHLPQVPTAEDVKKNGIDLGDNQKILLQKVEELTLYMIELNKKVETLAKENEVLKQKINSTKQ